MRILEQELTWLFLDFPRGVNRKPSPLSLVSLMLSQHLLLHSEVLISFWVEVLGNQINLFSDLTLRFWSHFIHYLVQQLLILLLTVMLLIGALQTKLGGCMCLTRDLGRRDRLLHRAPS